MEKEWICGQEGVNLKFKREALLNYGMNRWALNKAHSVGPTSELIRNCCPKSYEEWQSYYFENASQKKKNGCRITKEYIDSLGQRLHIKLSEVVQSELSSICEEECLDYAYNLVINRTYEGYQTEIDTIYGQLEKILNTRIEPASDILDRTYNVDFTIAVSNKSIGLQIKPISSGRALNYYQWEQMHEQNHKRFKQDFGGSVFFIFSKSVKKKKSIHNIEVVEEIRQEIKRLQDTQ
jgi:hypothetical protein